MGWRPDFYCARLAGRGRSAVAVDHAIVEVLAGGETRVVSNAFWNPFDFEWVDGRFIVVDAGRNALLALDLDGHLAEFATFERIVAPPEALQALSPTAFENQAEYLVDAVPTGLAVMDEGYFVTLLGGFPFFPGNGKLVRLPRNGGVATVVAEGLEAPIDVATDAQGRLFVLEMGLFDLGGGHFIPGTGRLVHLDLATGDRVEVATGLRRPISVATGSNDALVITEAAGRVLYLQPENSGR